MSDTSRLQVSLYLLRIGYEHYHYDYHGVDYGGDGGNNDDYVDVDDDDANDGGKHSIHDQQ